MVCLFLMATTWASPPQVLSTLPASGDEQVVPGLTELRVEFEQDMSTTSWSWVGGGRSFPEVVGAPHFEGPRVAVLPILLKPHHHYTVRVNSESFTNFVSAKGEPAEPYLIEFHTGPWPDGPERPARAALSAASTDMLLQLLQDHYSYLEQRPVDWEAELYQHALADARSPRAFADRAAQALGAAGDPHITLSLRRSTWTTAGGAQRNIDLDLLPALVPQWHKLADTVWTGRFEDGIGVINITSWDRFARGTEQALEQALRALWDTSALIIDVRANSGGDESLAAGFAGHFVSAPALYAKHRWRDPSAEAGFGPVQERGLQPLGERPYPGRVVVLTGPGVVSSCEAFLLMMKQVPGALLIGENSFGSSGNPRPYPLPNGVVLRLPGWQAMLPDGSLFEGVGITPDIRVQGAPAEGRDPVLEAALAELRR